MNELEGVVVGEILTGNLLLDLGNSDAKRDVNFYDVAIRGYTGKPKTQKERRLYEADAGKTFYIAPLCIAINSHKFLNQISGRTKELKSAVKLEKQIICINKVKSEFSNLLFADHSIEEYLKIQFFYYAAEDPKFETFCKMANNLEIYEFLLQKLYKNNSETEAPRD